MKVSRNFNVQYTFLTVGNLMFCASFAKSLILKEANPTVGRSKTGFLAFSPTVDTIFGPYRLCRQSESWRALVKIFKCDWANSRCFLFKIKDLTFCERFSSGYCRAIGASRPGGTYVPLQGVQRSAGARARVRRA